MYNSRGGLSRYLPSQHAPEPPRTPPRTSCRDASEAELGAADNDAEESRAILPEQRSTASVPQELSDQRAEADRAFEDRTSLSGMKAMPAPGCQTQAPKTFRRTVRSTSLTSYGDGVASHPVSSASLRKTSSIGLRMRYISSSVKGRVMRAFRKPSDSSDSVPQQQVDSDKLHFGDDPQWSEGSRYPFVPMPDREVASRCSSRASSTRDYPAPFNPMLRAGSARSTQSLASDGIKSRVTSWANSTVTEGTKRMLPAELKRLSVIHENGGPHEPSSSAGLVGTGVQNRRLHELFRRPLRAGAGRINEPVDSQVVYSALQQRLNEMSLPGEAREGIANTTSRNSMRRLSAQSAESGGRTCSGGSRETTNTTIRLVSGSSAADTEAKAAASGHSDDVSEASEDSCRGSPHQGSIAYSTHDVGRLKRHEEGMPHSPTRARSTADQRATLRPTYQHGLPPQLSPHRRGMLAKIAEEDKRATIYDPALTVSNMLSTSVSGQLPEDRQVAQSDSESNYSRDAGRTPISAMGSNHVQLEELPNGGRPRIAQSTGVNRSGRRELYCPSFLVSESTSDASDGQAEDRVFAALQAIHKSQSFGNALDAQPAQQQRLSRHIREPAQFHEDESDEAARYQWSYDGNVRDRGPAVSSTDRAPSVRMRSSRPPLSERDASHVSNVPVASATSANESLALKELLGENYRASELPNPPDHVSPPAHKASITSLAPQRNTDGECVGGTRTSLSRAGSTTSASPRHSPERIARLRRLQSRNALRLDLDRDPERPGPSKDENTSYYQFSRARYGGAHELPFEGPRQGSRTPGGSRMVEDFLSKRRYRQASEQYNEPAFL